MHTQRKADHLRISLEEDVTFPSLVTGFEDFRFTHCALPELDREAVDLTTHFLGRPLRVPILISSMTGGIPEAGEINRRLAQAAQVMGVAMGLGSQRAGLEDPEVVSTYQVRSVAPNVPLYANLGAVQFNYGYTVEHARRAVEMIEADGLILHLNPLQEALQPHGNTNFHGLLDKIAVLCRQMPVPVIVKEVGWGLSGSVARQLIEAGVAALDVAGAGGTSWSEVEKYRTDPVRRRMAEAFAGWGLPTAEALLQVRAVAPDLPLIASGGIRTGVDAAKALALGADLVGLASPLLKAAAQSAEAVIAELTQISEELRTAMFCVGAGDLAALRRTPLTRTRP